ncbi:MAG: hypothetical protein ACREME_00560, partial [Gemmatimonadales bacterium]
MADRAQRRDGRSARGGEWERSFPDDAAAQVAAVDLQGGSANASAGAVVGREPAPAAVAVVDRDSSGQPANSAGQPADSLGRPDAGETEPYAEPYMVGNSPALRRVFSILRCFARSDAPVLI